MENSDFFLSLFLSRQNEPRLVLSSRLPLAATSRFSPSHLNQSLTAFPVPCFQQKQDTCPHKQFPCIPPDRYQDGEEVTFTCKTNNIGVKTTWKVTCVNGTWQGGRSFFTCGADGADSTDATSKPGEEHEEDVDYGTQPCKWEKSEPKVVTFFGDQELTEEATFQPGDELVSVKGGEGEKGRREREGIGRKKGIEKKGRDWESENEYVLTSKLEGVNDKGTERK